MYSMTREDNILFAKRNIVDSIYKEARLEGIDATFPETNEIFEGRSVSGLSVDEIVAINNLKRAWGFVLDTLDAPVDLPYIRQLHGVIGAGIVTGAGQLRDYDVSIGGTAWRPDLPDYDRAKEAVAAVCSGGLGGEAGLVLFAVLCRMQLFADGNKRTAQLVANKLLIESGCGILAVPVEKRLEFGERLIAFYETNELAPFVDFVARECVDGYGERLPRAGAKSLDAKVAGIFGLDAPAKDMAHADSRESVRR